jgi:2-polyprenyl-6-methoxyphenol hydroxylase-like FAD-dependent oxidoreductase
LSSAAALAGLVAGIALQQAGLDVQVFERAEELRETGAGISLWTNAITALSKLGLADAIRSFSLPGVRGGLRSWQGTLLIDATTGPPRPARGELCLVVHRADLQTALVQALNHKPVHLGAQCLAFQQDAAGVTVEFADGGFAHGDLLVGADSLNSTVRAQLHGLRKPTDAGYTAWRAVAPGD